MKVMLKNARLAFSQNLFKPGKMNEDDTPAYSASLILDPENNAEDIKKVEEALAAAAKEKWGAKADAMLTKLRSADKLALHDGDTKADYDGFAGNLFVSARSKTRPTVVDRDRSPLTEADGRPYAGCYVNAQVEIWPMDNGFGKRINAQLRGVQFVADGEAFAGGGVAAADEFDELEPETADDLV
ncbi:ssDNA-binding protein [Guyparkeria halopsychrophila]|uniref:ssDNA-binding protein n=1 Tax=Guyparkeria halopsychrophila TaxID=3139421 RepID=UPI0037CBB019